MNLMKPQLTFSPKLRKKQPVCYRLSKELWIKSHILFWFNHSSDIVEVIYSGIIEVQCNFRSFWVLFSDIWRKNQFMPWLVGSSFSELNFPKQTMLHCCGSIFQVCIMKSLWIYCIYGHLLMTSAKNSPFFNLPPNPNLKIWKRLTPF